MNQQREIFYTKRLNSIRLADLTRSEDTNTSTNSINEVIAKIKEILSDRVQLALSAHYTDPEQKSVDISGLKAEILDLADDELIGSIIHKSTHFKALGFKNVDDLFSDPSKIQPNLQILVDELLKSRHAEFSNDIGEVFKITTLQTMDELWTEHLESVTDLREGIGLRGYAQRDPLVEYKNEAFDLFETLMNNINTQVAKRILKIRRVVSPIKILNNATTNENQISDIITGSREIAVDNSERKPSLIKPILNNIAKAPVGRNEPCPCGSGFKYKKCGLINSPKHRSGF